MTGIFSIQSSSNINQSRPNGESSALPPRILQPGAELVPHLSLHTRRQNLLMLIQKLAHRMRVMHHQLPQAHDIAFTTISL